MKPEYWVYIYLIVTTLLGTFLAGYEIAAYSEEDKEKQTGPTMLMAIFFGWLLAIPVLFANLGCWLHKKRNKSGDGK